MMKFKRVFYGFLTPFGCYSSHPIRFTQEQLVLLPLLGRVTSVSCRTDKYVYLPGLTFQSSVPLCWCVSVCVQSWAYIYLITPLYANTRRPHIYFSGSLSSCLRFALTHISSFIFIRVTY